jgi:geranylgeranyl diphosphate synthase type I
VTTHVTETDWNRACLAQMQEAIALLSERAPLLGEMARYHLGWSEDSFGDARSRGKMIRPLLAIESARAVAGDEGGRKAIPLAAAIELLHNFTLIHDDIQDNSPLRRHRPTVWSTWGVAQAINAGDALFAAAHIALTFALESGAPAEVVVALMRGFDATTIEIVSGQVLDLEFESRLDVRPDAYIEMITSKTARILEFAAGGGAWVAGADESVSAALASFGLALGIGFQVQDDLLGTFGKASDTGKASTDDIRRKKQSLPVLQLKLVASNDDRALLDELYGRSEIDSEGIASVLALMEKYEIEQAVRKTVSTYHDSAQQALRDTGLESTRYERLTALATRLESRTT